MQGTIKKIIGHKGYGFIETNENDEDIFFHRTTVKGSFDDLKEGDAVEFSIEQSFKGPQATGVSLIN